MSASTGLTSLKPLPPRRQRFIQEYLVDYNATRAAMRAGYSPRTANEQGCQLLAKLSFQVEQAKAQQASAAGLTRERVLNEIRRIAFADLSECFDEQGQLKDLKSMPIDVRRALRSCKVLRTNLVSGDGQRETVHEVQMWDKPKALEMAAKHLGMLDEHVEHDVHYTVTWLTEEKPSALDPIDKAINVTPLPVDSKDST